MFEDISRYIEQRVQAELEPQIKVLYDNVDTKPKSGETTLRLTDLGGFSRLISGTKDTGLYRLNGVLIISVYTPINVGTRNNNAICDTVANTFRTYTVDKLKFIQINKQRIGEERDLFRQDVTINYQFDMCNSN